MSAILLVEDNVEFGLSVVRELEHVGHAVRLVEGAQQAMDCLSELRSDSVILADQDLGGDMSGIELIEHFRHTRPATQGVIMGAFSTVSEYRSALAAGAIELLVKPFSFDELHAAIERVGVCTSGFHGHLQGVNLVDLLQLYHFGRRAVRVELELDGNHHAHVDMYDGDIIHAVFADIEGSGALQRILTYDSGRVHTSSLRSSHRTITERFETILMEAVRLNDEASTGTGEARVLEEQPFEFDIGSELESELDEDTDLAEFSRLVLDRLRTMDGFLGACLMRRDSGTILAAEGDMDLRQSARFAAEVLNEVDQMSRRLDVGADEIDVLVTTTSQYHVLRSVPRYTPLYLHLVVRSDATNEATVLWALTRSLAEGVG